MKSEKGLIYIFTGDGKGKTSAALGVSLRMLLLGKRVEWISWYKSKDWQISEKLLDGKFRGKIKMYWIGKGFYIKKGKEVTAGSKRIKVADVGRSKVIDDNSLENHSESAKKGLSLTEKILKRNIGRPDLLVMDELINAVNDNLVKLNDVLSIIKKRGQTNLILTGRGCPEGLIASADLVSEIKKIKHPFDVGKLAVRGLDY